MPRAMSENRYNLISYLTAMEFKRSTVFKITMMDLQTEEAITEMIEFCREHHPNLSEAQILEASYKISLKYPRAKAEELEGTEEE